MSDFLQCVLRCPVVDGGHSHTSVAQKGVDGSSFDLGKDRSSDLSFPRSKKLTHASESKVAGEWTAANQLAIWDITLNLQGRWPLPWCGGPGTREEGLPAGQWFLNLRG